VPLVVVDEAAIAWEEGVAERRGEHVHAEEEWEEGVVEVAADEEVVKAAAADEEETCPRPQPSREDVEERHGEHVYAEEERPRPQPSRAPELLRDDDVAPPVGPGSTDPNLGQCERSSPEEASEAVAAIIELAAAAAEAAREAARATRRGDAEAAREAARAAKAASDDDVDERRVEHVHAERAAKAASEGATPQKLSTARVKPGNPVEQPMLGNPVEQPFLTTIGGESGGAHHGAPLAAQASDAGGALHACAHHGAPLAARATELRPPSPILGSTELRPPSPTPSPPQPIADVEDAGAKGSLLPPILGSLLPPEYYTSVGLTKVSGDALSWVVDPNLVVDSVKAGEARTKAACEDSVKERGDGGDGGNGGDGGDREGGREGEGGGGELPNMGDETSRSAAVWQWLASTNASMASWWARGARDGAASAASDTAAEGAAVSAEGALGAEADGHGETSRARLGSQPSPVPALPPALFTVPWMSLPAWYDGEGLPNWGLVLGGPPPPVLEEVTALCRSSIRRCWLDLCGQVIASPCH
jgi:hypothetical protein